MGGTGEAAWVEIAARGPLRGAPSLPGDKSISHRALIVAAIADGTSRISGLNPGADVAATLAGLRAMGVAIDESGGMWRVHGLGRGGFTSPAAPIDCANSGTTARLLMGLAAGQGVDAGFTGDASLQRRPMTALIAPLRALGAHVEAAPGEQLPLLVRGTTEPEALVHRLDAPSAQVKTALLLASLEAAGVTAVIEPAATRDHGERMLARFGARIRTESEGDARQILLTGRARLEARDIRIPTDPSAAAFLAVAASIVPGSAITMACVGINAMRTGLTDTLQLMGAALWMRDRRDLDGEPVADLAVRQAPLRAVDVPAVMAPAMIDEYPAFFVAAAFADGTSRAHGLGALRHKESDRLVAMAEALRAIGARVTVEGDDIAIEGTGGAPLAGGADVETGDHRVAMALAVAGMNCRAPIRVRGMETAAISFPGFVGTIGLVRGPLA